MKLESCSSKETTRRFVLVVLFSINKNVWILFIQFVLVKKNYQLSIWYFFGSGNLTVTFASHVLKLLKPILFNVSGICYLQIYLNCFSVHV